MVVNFVLGLIFEEKTQKQKGKMYVLISLPLIMSQEGCILCDCGLFWITSRKLFSFQMKHQAKNILPSDVKRTRKQKD